MLVVQRFESFREAMADLQLAELVPEISEALASEQTVELRLLVARPEPLVERSQDSNSALRRGMAEQELPAP